jgi:hypothetical protein
MREKANRVGQEAVANQRLEKISGREIRPQHRLRRVAEREQRGDLGSILGLNLLQ